MVSGGVLLGFNTWSSEALNLSIAVKELVSILAAVRGGVLHGFNTWSSEALNLSIAVKELVPILIAGMLWGDT